MISSVVNKRVCPLFRDSAGNTALGVALKTGQKEIERFPRVHGAKE